MFGKTPHTASIFTCDFTLLAARLRFNPVIPLTALAIGKDAAGRCAWAARESHLGWEGGVREEPPTWGKLLANLVNQCGIVWELEFYFNIFFVSFLYSVIAVMLVPWMNPEASIQLRKVTLWAIPEWTVYIGEVVGNHVLDPVGGYSNTSRFGSTVLSPTCLGMIIHQAPPVRQRWQWCGPGWRRVSTQWRPLICLRIQDLSQ